MFAGTKQALGDARTAEQLLRQAMELDPAWTPTLATLGELLLGSGRVRSGAPAAAGGRWAAADYAGRTAARAPVQRFWASRGGGGHRGSVLRERHTRCRAHRPARHGADRPRARAAGDRGLPTALAQSPNSPGAAQALASTLNMTGNRPRARALHRRLLGRGHRSAALYLTLARSLIAQGERLPPSKRCGSACGLSRGWSMRTTTSPNSCGCVAAA